MEPPLSNVRIVSVEQYGAGPFGTLFLASLGAEVIKIENPGMGGDVSRGIGPYFSGDGSDSDSSLFFRGLNHNKKSVALDISTDEGKKAFHALVGTADAVYTNLRGDVPAKLGLTYEHLKEFNKRIVCAHLTGYGRDNERATRPGYDYIMQAEAGYFSLTGEPTAPPTRFGLSIIDLMTGVTTSFGLAACLYQSLKTGVGRDVDVSLFDVALYNLNYVAMWYMNADAEQSRVERSAHFALVPCQLFETSDGWIYIMCNKEKFWVSLCERTGAVHLLNDARFKGFAARLENRQELTALLDAVLRTQSTDEWMRRFSSHIPASPVLSLADALDNPFLETNGNIRTINKGANDSTKVLRNPVRFGDDIPLTSAPELGEHTDELLLEVGYSEQQIQSFRDDGIIL